MESNEEYWFAYRVFHNKIKSVIAQAQTDGWRVFVPMRTVEKVEGQQPHFIEEPVIPSLVFIRSTKEYMMAIRKDPNSYIGVYCHPGTPEPAVIDDREMDIFMFVTTTGCQRLDAVDEKLVKGDRIRVTGGLFKGAEGYITRVHGTKRFVVVIKGVAAVATTFVPRCYIEKIG